MARITSDLGLGACEHVLEAEDEIELQRLVREHASEAHQVELDDERAILDRHCPQCPMVPVAQGV